MDPHGRQNVSQSHIRVPRYHLVCPRYGGGSQFKYGVERLHGIGVHREMIDGVCSSSEFLPHGVVGCIVVYFCC